MYKILIKYSKTERMKFLSHLELIKVMERALRRAEVPLKFSQGYNPHPKIAFADPLAVGVSGEGEYLTIEVEEEMNMDSFKDKLNSHLPNGLKFLKCKYINSKTKALMSIVEYASYIVKCEIGQAHEESELKTILKSFLGNDEILYEKVRKKKKNRIINVRELIKEIFILSIDGKELIFKMIVSTGSRGNLKPEIVIEKLAELEELDIDLEKIRVHKLETFTLNNEKGLIPLEKIN